MKVRGPSRSRAGRIPPPAAATVRRCRRRKLRLHRAGIEPGNIQQRAEYFLDRFERGIDVADQIAVVTAALAFAQAGDVEPGGVERLQNVVTGRGDESRLGDIGLVGFGLGAMQFGIKPGQLGGALADAALQRGIGALQRFGGLDARRDVGERRDEAAVGHTIGPHLDHQPALAKRSRKGASSMVYLAMRSATKASRSVSCSLRRET